MTSISLQTYVAQEVIADRESDHKQPAFELDQSSRINQAAVLNRIMMIEMKKVVQSALKSLTILL